MLFATLVASCSSSDNLEEQSNVGYGAVSIAMECDDVISTTAATRSDEATYQIPTSVLPTSGADFSLTLSGTYVDPDDGLTKDFYQTYTSLADFNEVSPDLPAGDYFATLTDKRGTIDTESSTNAVFGGSTSFTIEARKYDSVAAITLTLLNSIIRLDATEYFDKYFEGGARIVLSTESGSELIYNTYASANDSSGDDAILFVAPATKLYIEGVATKQAATESGTATSVTFAKTLVGYTTVATITSVSLEASEAGGSAIQITIDESVKEITPSDIELNQ